MHAYSRAFHAAIMCQLSVQLSSSATAEAPEARQLTSITKGAPELRTPSEPLITPVNYHVNYHHIWRQGQDRLDRRSHVCFARKIFFVGHGVAGGGDVMIKREQ
jgi:hypothetical protein